MSRLTNDLRDVDKQTTTSVSTTDDLIFPAILS